MPAATPVTRPPELTVAFVISSLLHVPPDVASARAAVVPGHIFIVPVMIAGTELTVTCALTLQPVGKV